MNAKRYVASSGDHILQDPKEIQEEFSTYEYSRRDVNIPCVNQIPLLFREETEDGGTNNGSSFSRKDSITSFLVAA